ncbi:ABC transporter permease [Mycetocola tolaasinivorans]|uniref:ABC transporter permease n=1 Tax=Mycetocola tolaasinivorans TaxID=76635 RepID=A0A3L7A7Q7_9MICO|nr:ABC transporter permease [Mycetocola tolaasinivorans]RLP76406.1 ABC transporter permease [Mycetocola tolaasinivorans]
MARYIFFRLLQAIPVLLGTTLLIYYMVFAMPGDPILALFGDKTPTAAQIEALREQYHLNEPFIMQYLRFLGGIFVGDLGTTYSGQPVISVLQSTFPVTLRLALLALIIETVFGIGLGLLSGLRKGGASDNIILAFSLLLISLPIFVIAFVLQYLLSFQLGIFRATVGEGAPWSDLMLPAIVLATASVAQIIRLARTSVIETAGQDFVRTAYGKGLSRGRVIPVHILRNSLIPVVTYIGTDLGVMMVGATVTEGIFNVPGVGRTLFQAIRQSEGPTVVSFVTVMVLLYLILNLLIDLLYAVLDPRIRYVK